MTAVDQTARDAAAQAQTEVDLVETDVDTAEANIITAQAAADAAQADATAAANPSARTDVSATRSFNTIYQNTGSKPMYVEVIAEDPTNGYGLHLESDAATPPTYLLSSEISLMGGESGTVQGMVLPSHYYKVTYAGATIVSWYETV